MIEASAKIDELEDKIYPDGDGSEIAEELRKKEYRLKKLHEASYSSYDNLEYAEGKGLDLYMPDNFLEALDEKEEGERQYHKSNFRYDETRDSYICPEGKELRRWAE